jgi:hypothetical protein
MRHKSFTDQGENFMKFQTAIEILVITLLFAVIIAGTIAMQNSVPALMATVSWNG